MKTPIFLTLVALAYLSFNGWAQSQPPTADDAQALVAPLSYQSVFKDQAPPVGSKDAPDQHWIQGNRAVQGNESMGNMKMGGMDMKSMDMKEMNSHMHADQTDVGPASHGEGK